MKDSLFWEFGHDRDDIRSTVVGTIHLSVPEVMLHWSRITALIDRYPRVFTESEMDAVDQSSIGQYVYFNEPDVRYRYVTRNRWKRMQRTFAKYFNIDIDAMRDMRPLFVIAALYQRIGQDGGQALDHRIWQYAVNNNKETLGLESIEEQVYIMMRLSLRAQYTQLVRMSRSISTIKKKYRRLIQTYQDQHIRRMLYLSKGSLGMDKTILLHDRNTVMVDRMIEEHEKQPSFFCFGAGHLAGKNGVLSLLKRKGLVIRAIDCQPPGSY